MAGTVFVVQGDITEFQADAVVCPTSTTLSSQGFAFAAFASRFPWFAASYSMLRDEHPVRNDRGQRLRIGDAIWLPSPNAEDRVRGVVVVAVAGGRESIADRAAASVRNAIRTARTHLRKQDVGSPRARWLIALPAIGLGMGGYSKELKTAVGELAKAAAAEIRSPETIGENVVEVDVAFVAFTALNYRLLLDARRSLGVEPPCPIVGSDADRLLESIRERRCVLFVGAGLSRGAGLPGWGGLLSDLANSLNLDVEKLPRDANGQLSLDLCLDLAQWFADKFGRPSLDERIFDRFGSNSLSIRPTLAHYLLMSMPFRLCLTTNYDDLLERTLTALRRDPEVVLTPEQVGMTGQAERPCVVKLHGDAGKRTPIVLTRDDFDTFFRNHPVTTALLQGLLLNHTFLFVGYDLRDPNTRQIYSGVAHLVRQSGTRAFSIAIRDEDATSRFYEQQWSRQGLITLRMPGIDRIHGSVEFFDWLSRETFDVQSFLHPNLRHDPSTPAKVEVESLHGSLFRVCDELESLLRGRLSDFRPEQVKMLAGVMELVTNLGWKTASHQGWERLADAAASQTERLKALRRALAAAEGIADIERLRERIRNEAGPGKAARS